MNKLVILIPPSEGKQSGGKGKPLGKIHAVTRELLYLIEKSNPDKLYSGRKEEAIEMNAKAESSPTMKAIERYTGVVYDALDYASLDNQKYIDEHVLIVSALFGLVKPTDMIPDYKLSINKLRAWKLWKPANARKLQGCFAIDLLPQAHKRAVEYKDGVEIEFTRMRRGKVVKSGHEGKHIKGRYIRWLAEQNITNPEDIYSFSEDGYKWNGKAFHKESE